MTFQTPTPRRAASPPEVRMVFSENLRQLLQAGPSIAALCRDLQLNRTQFHRFLTGEACPRQDVLKKICDYFGVDGRILLEPLSQIQPLAGSQSDPILREVLLPEGSRPFDDYFFPDGYYRYWRRSFSSPGNYVSGIWRVRRAGAVKHVDGWEVYPYAIRSGTRRFARKNHWAGVVVQAFDGVKLYTRAESETVVTFTFLEFGVPHSSFYLRGISVLARRHMAGASRMTPLLAERVGTGRGDLLRAARGCGMLAAEALPAQVRQALDSTDLF
ncbi:helix-turn-helix domain-containing protein [Falsigemmobacter faecalis]|uniref:XRE family transcriptional regulator n=1 Tax=Falsigemmobacter faecalis TaxID=2488730 RepID=A0A3P3DQ64_9RHOB|nr:helix-turn-helix transcriptional regulator [Falsigemmobacter faecalis]RRH76301.1 XRE family transcriptional regulator [Falsigemmobacter faecalis]